MTKAQHNRVLRIKQRWFKFKYSLEADGDIRFLLTMILGKDVDKPQNRG